MSIRIKSISRPIIAITMFLSLLCVSCNKKEEGKVTVMTKPVTEITTTSAKSGGNVTVTGSFSVGVCGVCWSENPSPSTNEQFTTDNQGIGEYSSSLRNLSPNTKYYLRAYATTSSGIIYGEELSFYTEALPQATISVITNEVTEITASTAKCGGVVTADSEANIVARGVCWNTSPNPIVNDAHTSDGQGIGVFSSSLVGLSDNTKYYIKAYATTVNGDIFYGEEKSFVTDSISGGGNNEILITVYTNEVSEITTTTAKCGGLVTANGETEITARGICWSTSPTPTIADRHTSDGQGLGSFTSNAIGLVADTPYYIRAYATNSNGTTIYGDQKAFTTEAQTTTAELPTVTIGAVSAITGNAAKCNGNVTSDGGATVTECGICWNTLSNPMIYHHKAASDQPGTGNFSVEITGLESGTTYYVKAYATNSEGTAYSEDELTFSTWDVPTITTASITTITANTAVGGGTVTSDGGTAVTSRGICWSTTDNPTIEDSHTSDGSGLGSFTSNITGLSPSTRYYVRAYAINSIGTSYGNPVSFSTEQSTVTLSDFLGLYSVSAFNRDTQQTETWTGTNIAVFNNPNTNSTWVKVEGLMDGSDHDYFHALGEYSEEHHAIRLYGTWHFTSSYYHFYFNSDPDIYYYALFYPIYQTTTSTWYYLENGSGYNNTSEAWLTMNTDGTVSLSPSEYPDDNGRFANGFVFAYFKVEDDSYAGRFDRYINVKMTKTSKVPIQNGESHTEVGDVKIVPEKEQSSHRTNKVLSVKNTSKKQ